MLSHAFVELDTTLAGTLWLLHLYIDISVVIWYKIALR